MATLAQNIQRAIDDFNSIENAIVQKGVPVPDGTPTSEYGEKILSIETGVDTSGDTVVPSALREGYTAHDAAGQEITGTIPNYDGDDTVEMTSPEGATLNTAGKYCDGNIEVVPKLQSKTATTGEIVTADAGYVGLSEVDTNPAFEAGKKSEYDAFWDAYQNYGNYEDADFSTERLFAFARWTDKNFFPKYDIKIYAGDSYNAYFLFASSLISNLTQRLKDCGVTLDTSAAKRGNEMFAWCPVLTHVPTTSLINLVEAVYIFAGCHKLIEIEKLILPEDRIFDRFQNLFNGCRSLQTLIVEGTIGQNGFNVSWSPLSKASLTSIVNALSSTTTGLTVTLRLAAVNTAFETSAGAADGSTSEEWTALIATKPNWTINLINS